MEIKEVIVVEGKEDTRRLKEIFKKVYTIETRGSAIDQETIELIKKAHNERGVIIFTDPDFPGKRIRTIINQAVPGCKNAYIEKHKAISENKKKIGVEHCSKDDIIQALSSINMNEDNQKSDVIFSDLYKLNLIGHHESSLLRKYIDQRLSLGHNNGKQLFNKIQMLGIRYQTLENLVKEYYSNKSE